MTTSELCQHYLCDKPPTHTSTLMDLCAEHMTRYASLKIATGQSLEFIAIED